MKKLLIVILFYIMQSSAFADTTAVIGIPWCIYNQTTIKPCANITDVQSDILIGFSNISSDTVTMNTLGVGTTDPTSQVHIELRGDDSIFIDGTTNEREITTGAIQIEHTAGTSGTRPININVNANNQFDTHAINSNFTATGVSGNDENHVYDAHIDTANSTGGNVGVFVCSKTGTGTLSAACVNAYTGVDPVKHNSGTLDQAEAAFLYDGAFDNVTAEFRSNSNNATLFVSNGDYVYLGDANKFDDIEFDLVSFSTNPGIKPTVEFSEGGGTWASLGVSDGTNGFRQNGNMRWSIEPLITWAVDTVNGVANKYWVRILRNQNNVTSPVEDTVKILESVIYSWDEGGLVSVSGVATDTIDAFSSGSAIEYLVNQQLPLFESHSSFTLDETHQLIECDATFQNVSIFFPSASSYQGVCFSVKKMDDSNWCYLSTIGAEGFDSLSSIEITEQYYAPKICGGTTEWGLR
jgi:hypothetical protein